VVKEGEEGAPKNEDELIDADTALMTGELSHLLNDLIEALGGVEGAK
jgi:DNA recombination-dependent growth factor C